MFAWHHRLDGHEFEQALEDGEGLGSLMCCSSRIWKELDITERLNNNKDTVGPPSHQTQKPSCVAFPEIQRVDSNSF